MKNYPIIACKHIFYQMAEKSDKTKKPIVHPNTIIDQLFDVQPTKLKDIILQFSAIRPLEAIRGIPLPSQFLDGADSGIVANTSCSLLLFLENLGSLSKKQMKWAKELVKSGRLPTEFQLDSFLQLMKNVKSRKHDMKKLSELIERFLNLLRTNFEKKDVMKNVGSFLKQSNEGVSCAKGGAGKKGKRDAEKDAEKDAEYILNLVIDNVFKNKDPYEFLTGVPSSDAVSAFILAVMTQDERDNVEENFDFLGVLDGFDECNIVQVLFDIKPVFHVSLAFWKAHIQESNKTDTFHVSLKEVEAFMLGFLRSWGGFVFGQKITISTITRLYNEVMHGLAFLSGCGSQSSSKLVNVSLAIIHRVLQNIESRLYVGLDGDFFQNVGECLGFELRTNLLEDNNIETSYDMSAVQTKIDVLTDSWGKLCYRAGLSNDRAKILDFLRVMYKKDIKSCLIILRTFVGSGKTASLTILMLLKLLLGQSAVFMTPCPSEVINFFAGIRFQIEGLISSDAFKSLKKDDEFKVYMLELIGRLDKLRVFESPLALGQKLDPTFINIFVLAPTQVNIMWLLGNRYDMLVLDDVSLAHELARRVSIQGHGCPIIVSGADVGEFDAGEFLPQGYSVNVCDIQNRIDVRSMWCDATCGRDSLAFKALEQVFQTRLVRGSLKYSELGPLFQKIGISIKGGVKVSSKPVYKAEKVFGFLRYIAVDPRIAVAKLYGLYQKQMLMSFDTGMKFGDKAIVYETGDEVSCIATLLSSLVQVEDATYVPPTFSKMSFDSVAQNNDGEGDSNPQSSGGDDTSFKTNKNESSKKTAKDPFSKGEKRLLKKNADENIPLISSKEVPTRPATMEDIRLKTPVAQNPLRLSPTEKQKTVFKTLVAKLNLPENYKIALITLFENGVGRVSRMFPSEYNEFVASVFRQNGLSYISTSYPLESMNLGHVSAVVVMSSISEGDLRQLLGRMNRANSGSFLQMFEDGRLVLIVLDNACQDDAGGRLVGGGGAVQDLDFQSIVELGDSLLISEIVSALCEVLRGSFDGMSSMFPLEFQQRIESLFTSSIFRAFHPAMRLSDRNVLPRDCACVIASAIDLMRFPIIDSGNTPDVLKSFFGTSYKNMENFFGGCANLMPVLCATKVYEIQGFDTPELIGEVLSELSKVASAIECALCVVSMTTPNLESMKQVIRERMSVIATLLSRTSSHLRVLITLFETKRATILRNLEKSEAKLGAVVREVEVNQDALDFSSLVESTLDSLLTSAKFRDIVANLDDFISSHGDREIIANAKMFLEKINGLEEERALFFENTSISISTRDCLCQERDKLSVFAEWSTLCLSTVVNSKGKSFKLLEMLTALKVGEDNKILLASVNALTKKPEFNQDLTAFYGKVCGLLVRAGFLQQGQCDGPDPEGKVSVDAFNALKRAMEVFSKNVPADLSDVKARFAELTAEIDRLQQELFVLRNMFESNINGLRHFTKMG